MVAESQVDNSTGGIWERMPQVKYVVALMASTIVFVCMWHDNVIL